MPLLIWLSACSYWRRANAEMMRATLQFLDHVERPQASGGESLEYWASERAALARTRKCASAPHQMSGLR
jgi:hypothetical protein